MSSILPVAVTCNHPRQYHTHTIAKNTRGEPERQIFLSLRLKVGLGKILLLTPLLSREAPTLCSHSKRTGDIAPQNKLQMRVAPLQKGNNTGITPKIIARLQMISLWLPRKL